MSTDSPPAAGSHGHAQFGISVAAELVGVGVQNLRAYEERGLVAPYRTPGGTRRYSPADLEIVERITDLLERGLNLAGIAMVLPLEDENARLRDELDRRPRRSPRGPRP
ncbi:MAG: MerR family transcriptional regulator [Nocardioidaceae bacterium]|nr:MerR family transcriptional regulator [Nocardioidaceae bacterium]